MRGPGRLLVHALFFASGATALVYQVVWVRSLSLILGASHLAVSIVLAAFMGGLALGALALGRRAAGRAHPLCIYGWLELGIAACALALPFVLRVLQGVYVSLALALEEQAGGAALAAFVRAVLAFGALVVPTFLMGGTLPVLVAAVVRRHAELHARLASLYAINTFGAAAGALVAGFALLPSLGVRSTELLAAAGNLAIGVTALGWSHVRARADDLEEPAPAPTASAAPAAPPVPPADADVLRLVFASTALCGFGALALEVLWTRAISVVIGSNVYSFTVMLVAFLCGIALGSAIHGALPRRLSEGVHFALLAAAIAVSTLAVSFAIPRLHELVAWQKPAGAAPGFDPWSALVACFLVMLVPCVLHGMAFPLAGEARARMEERPARSVGELVGLNTAGSIAGSLAAGFVLIPFVGMQRSLLAISALYASAAIALAAAVWLGRMGRRSVVQAVAAAALAAVWIGVFAAKPWDQRSLGTFRNNESVDLLRARVGDDRAFGDATVLYYREGRSSTISVVEDSAGVRRLQIDGKVVASDASSDLRHELLLGHLPVLAHRAPRSALVVGLGAGVTLGAVAAHPELESITAVEIEAAVAPGSRLFAHVQGDPLDDPRVQLVVQDGRNYLLGTSRRFDVITADPIHPWVRGSGYLYTREYYELARAHLTENGVMCQWLPLYQLGPEDLRAAVGAFVDVFPHATLWSTPADAVLIGTLQPLRIDLPDWQRRLAAPEVHQELARVGLSDLLSLVAEFALTSDGMRRFAGDAPRNTDDNVFLEFSSPRHMGAGHALLESNWRLLESLAESPAPLLGRVEPLFASHADAERALAQVLAAKAALSATLAANLALPERIARLREIAKGPPPYGPAQDELAWQLRLLGRGLLAEGDAAQAQRAFELSSLLSPLDWRARVELAWALRRRGDREAAISCLQEALRLAPHAPPAHYELASVLLESGRAAEAVPHLRAAASARPSWAEPRNDLAWLLVTDPAAGDEGHREGLALAQSAAALTGSRDPEILDTLAVAYAANGRTDAAREVAEQALALARAEHPALVSTLEARSAAFARGDFNVSATDTPRPTGDGGGAPERK
jgi:spermidine synthase